MTMRILAATCITAGLISCSLFDENASLDTLWITLDEAQVPTASVSGALGPDLFYSMRGRANPAIDPRLLAVHRRADGELVWERTIDGPCDPPILSAGRMFCPGSTLSTFDAVTGEPLWTFEPDSALSLVSGTADAERVYAGTLMSAIALDAATGALVWQRGFSGPWAQIRMRSLTLASNGDLLVAFSGEFERNVVFSVSVIVAVDPATGEERWRFVDGDETTDKDIGGLTLWEGLALYVSATGREAVAVDLATREVVWRAPMGPTAFSGEQPPAVRDGVAYYTDTTGGVYAVDARTGAEIWTTQRPAGFFGQTVCGDLLYTDNPIGEFFRLSDGRYVGDAVERDSDDIAGQTASADGVLYLSADSGVYAFDCRL